MIPDFTLNRDSGCSRELVEEPVTRTRRVEALTPYGKNIHMAFVSRVRELATYGWTGLIIISPSS
jgi:hypothetical protein